MPRHPHQIPLSRLREMFPSPSVDGPESCLNPNACCVLGAACRALYHPRYNGFPSADEAADVLGISEAAATIIAWFNDKGNFDRAWHELDNAFRRREAPTPQL